MKRVNIGIDTTVISNNQQITVTNPANLYFTWFGGEVVVFNNSGSNCVVTGRFVLNDGINDVSSYTIGDQETVTFAWDNGYYATPQSTEVERIGGMDKDVYDPQTIEGDAFSRSNMTGTQEASTISDFDTEVSNNVDVAANKTFRETPSTVIAAGTNIFWSGNTLNATGGSGGNAYVLDVTDPGNGLSSCTADGVVDDTTNFQAILNFASTNKLDVLIPPTKNVRITASVSIKSNTRIFGYGASITRDSSASNATALSLTDSNDVSNVQIYGVTIQSVNDQPNSGDPIFGNRTVSNINAFVLSGVDNLLLKDVTCDQMNYGIACSFVSTAIRNNNIQLNNFRVTNAATGMLLTSVTNLKAYNVFLDGSGDDTTSKLHGVYFDGECFDLDMSGIHCQNFGGGALHVFDSYVDRDPCERMTFRNVYSLDCPTGIYLQSGCNNVHIYDFVLDGITTGFNINNASNLVIKNGEMINIVHATNTQRFGITDCSYSTFENIYVDETSAQGNFVRLDGIIKDVKMQKITMLNSPSSTFIFDDNATSIDNFILDDGRFEWTARTSSPISIADAAYKIIVKDCTFINTGTDWTQAVFASAGVVTVQNCEIEGFTNMTDVGTVAYQIDCYNRDTSAYLSNKNLP